MNTSKQKEQTRKRVERYRDKQKSVTPSSGVTQGCNAVEMVPASYVMGLNEVMYEALPERPRYLTLSDGQVLDRLDQPEGGRSGDTEMVACNESAYNFKVHRPSKERMKVLEKLS